MKKAAAGVLIALAVLTVLCGAALFGGWLWFRESVEKAEFDPAVYDEQVSMMEMVLDVDDICNEMRAIREQSCKYLG